MRVGIALSERAYLPEAYAYQKYLSANSFKVQLASREEIDADNDLNIYFMGLRPFWNLTSGRAVEIHEYHSLSTGEFPQIKDYLKKCINKKPVGRIFLNQIVRANFKFRDNISFLLRDMGVDKELFQKPTDFPEFDIVYCGSISGRHGLLDEVERLAAFGYKILMIGDVLAPDLQRFSVQKNVVFSGRVARHEIAGLYKKCRAGLNYMPNIYPLNIQTSTKTLEYLASGLRVLSSRYHWAENFFKNNDARCIYLDEIKSYKLIESKGGGVDEYEWGNLLSKSNLKNFLYQACE